MAQSHVLITFRAVAHPTLKASQENSGQNGVVGRGGWRDRWTEGRTDGEAGWGGGPHRIRSLLCNSCRISVDCLW